LAGFLGDRLSRLNYQGSTSVEDLEKIDFDQRPNYPFVPMALEVGTMKTKSLNIKKLDLSVEWDAVKLRNLMTNAKRLGREDIYFDAVRQIARIEGQNIDDPLEADFAIAMRALEEALTAESGQTKRLSRTRQKLKRAGVKQTLADLAASPTPSQGFIKLVEFKMADMSAEALILKYKAEFDEETVGAARKRLAEHGVELAA
jgi:isopentenyl diphosphate isomerase/L-lactate dehydrogenase-like FMN-dependent dehydrogenase